MTIYETCKKCGYEKKLYMWSELTQYLCSDCTKDLNDNVMEFTKNYMKEPYRIGKTLS